MISRFVVQEHTTVEGVHWDLMLEQDGVLATFRLEEEPAKALTREVQAVKIFDHPLRFLTYEGPVQKGTGKVRIADSGVYSYRDRRDDLWTLAMNGAILKGDFTLTRTESTEWRFAIQNSCE
ncbi:MAG: DNA polymerase ligase N-terminal domain-containing protein [Phycisphaerales bacterium]